MHIVQYLSTLCIYSMHARETRVNMNDAQMHENLNGAALKPDEAHAILGTKSISRRAFYNALNRNEIPNVRLGRRILIPRNAFFRWLEGAQAAAR